MDPTSNRAAHLNGNGRALDEPLEKPKKQASSFQKRLGFVKSYNYKLWLTLTIAIVIFSVAHMPFIPPDNFVKLKAAPGEAYWYRGSRYRYGMMAHLIGVLPCGALAPLQFIPALRRPKWIALHRYIGYFIVTMMALVGIPGAIVITNHSFGGTLDTQMSLVVFASAVYTALGLGVYNIWKLQLDQHRKWMLRAMVWMAEITTQRFWLILLAYLLAEGGYQTVWTCEEARFTELNSTLFNTMFPQCQTLAPNAKIIVLANLSSNSLVEEASALRITFGAGVWMGLVFHILATELYLALTKDETERLRRISYTLQQKAGYKNPGSAGLTADRLGDSSWSPPIKSVIA